jgi:hypothetical protein
MEKNDLEMIETEILSSAIAKNVPKRHPGPVSKVPSDILTKPKLASMASVTVHRLHSAQQVARAPEQNHAVAFITAVVASTSEIAPEKVVRIGSGFQVEHNHGRVSEKVRHHGGILSLKENRGGRPVPGSSSFVRANQMDTSTAPVKKLLSGDYLAFYKDHLSRKWRDSEDGHRKSVSDRG